MPALRGALVGALLGLAGAVVLTALLVVAGQSGDEEANVGLAYAPLFLLVLGLGGVLGGTVVGGLTGLLASQLSERGSLSPRGRRAGTGVAAAGGFLAGLVTLGSVTAGPLLAIGVAVLVGGIAWTAMPWVVGAPPAPSAAPSADPAAPGPPPSTQGRVLTALALGAVGFFLGAATGGGIAEMVTDDRDLASGAAFVGAVLLASLAARFGWTRARR